MFVLLKCLSSSFVVAKAGMIKSSNISEANPIQVHPKIPELSRAYKCHFGKRKKSTVLLKIDFQSSRHWTKESTALANHITVIPYGE